MIEDGFVTGLKSGDYKLTLVITDSEGNKYSNECAVYVDSDGSGITENIEDRLYFSEDGLYSIEGYKISDRDANPGIYIKIVEGKAKKVLITK